jgi:WD40 repeat protein
MRDVKSSQGDELKDKIIPKLNISTPISESGEECRSSKKQLKKSRKSSIQPSQNSNIQRVNNVEFPTNEECTSLTISPSGRHIVAGFTDGTLRIFDTTGRFWSCTKIDSALPTDSHDRGTLKGKSKGLIDEEDISNLFDCDSDSESEISSAQKSRSPGRVKGGLVFSKSHQKYGAVACQIHARGVITSLLMDVQCSDDGRFVFGGVLRGVCWTLF